MRVIGYNWNGRRVDDTAVAWKDVLSFLKNVDTPAGNKNDPNTCTIYNPRVDDAAAAQKHVHHGQLRLRLPQHVSVPCRLHTLGVSPTNFLRETGSSEVWLWVVGSSLLESTGWKNSSNEQLLVPTPGTQERERLK